MTVFEPDRVPPDRRILLPDRIPELEVLRFVPTMASRQRDQPFVRCEDRVIGNCELLYYEGGSGLVIAGGERIECRAGTVALIRPWELHSIVSSPADPHDNHWVHFRIVPEPLATSALDAAFPPGRRGACIGSDPILVSAFSFLETEIARKEPGYAEIASGLLAAIFIRVWRMLQGTIGLRVPDRETLLLARIEDRIRSLLPRRIDIGSVCDEFAVGRSALYDMYRRRRGISPAAWIRRERLFTAGMLVKCGGHTLAEIAERTGFCDAFHLSRSFKEVFGSSPRDWAAGFGR